MAEANLKEALELTDVDIDLVIVTACQSEFVGELFIKSGAKHVICVDKNGSVLDEVAIDFTLNLYQRVLDGTDISVAFDTAKKNS